MPRFIVSICVVLAIGWSDLATSIAADHPWKMASGGRFDLKADQAVGELRDGAVEQGNVRMDRMNWLPANQQAAGFTLNGSVTHRGWRTWAVKFTPVSSGTVSLSLMGPWEEASKGVIFRQDVLWDAIEVTGATLENGSFENGSGKTATGWAGGVEIVSSSSETQAVEGQRLARTWHNAALTTNLKVTGGKSVQIKLSVRAAVPPDFSEMPRITSRDTPAHKAVKRFAKGTNFGNYLEAPKGQDWGAKCTPEDFRLAKAEGFDHVRLPIAWHHNASGPEFTLSKEIFSTVDELVSAAVSQKLGLIIDIHHYDDFTSDPAKHREHFLKLWQQIAEHYASQPDLVAFELLNEPKDAATTDVLNPIFAEAIKLIRKSNPQRTIFVATGRWNSVQELPNLKLPADDQNLIVTLHCYEPFYFTHQGAHWSGDDTKVTGIRFPGPPDKPLVPDASLNVKPYVLDWIRRYNTLPTDQNPSSSRAFQSQITDAKEWSDYYGRPVHFGEFGCYDKADVESRVRFYREFRTSLDRAGIAWAIWDWKAGFRYWDPQTKQPVPGMREALFTQPAK